MDCSLPGSSVHGILQARILEWVAISFSRDFFSIGDGLVAKSCLTFVCVCVSHFYDPMDCSLPGSSVHGILQARILEWVAISFSEHMKVKNNSEEVRCSGCSLGVSWGLVLLRIKRPFPLSRQQLESSFISSCVCLFAHSLFGSSVHSCIY